MRADEDEKRQGVRDIQSTLEVQRRRAAFHSWILLALTLALVLTALLFLPQGSSSSGEIQGGPEGHWVKYIRGSAAFSLLVSLAFGLFKQAFRSLDWARSKEKEQIRHLLWMRRSVDGAATIMEAIQILEKGADAQLQLAPPKEARRSSVQRQKSLPVSQE